MVQYGRVASSQSPERPTELHPARILRIITRLNIGGPAIQATSLTTALCRFGFQTLLIHGRLGPREGDMSYLVPPEATVVHLPALRRPISPIHDSLAYGQILRWLGRFRPAILHTHTAKAGKIGRAHV